MAKQLNIFVENKPGRLKSITEILSNKKVNIISFTVQDRGDFGLMKLLIDKPDEAYLALADKGYACALKDIVAVSIKDKPGNLFKLASVLLEHKINVVDTHGFVIDPTKNGICCLEVKDAAGIKKLLQKEGFKILDDVQLSD